MVGVFCATLSLIFSCDSCTCDANDDTNLIDAKDDANLLDLS